MAETNKRIISQHFSFYNVINDKVTGLSSYTDSIVAAYAESFPDTKIILHTNAQKCILPRCLNQHNITFKKMDAPSSLHVKIRSLWAHTKLAYELRGVCRPVISTTPHASIIPFCSSIITMHDMYDTDFRYRGILNVVFTRILYLYLRFVVDRVIAVSDTTAKLAEPYFGLLGAKIIVAKEASKFSNQEPTNPPPKRIKGQLLYVANVTPTKNFECLIDMLKIAESEAHIDMHVAWVGNDWMDIAKNAMSKRNGCELIRELGSVSEGELIDLYMSSDALIVTSWTEGFCLPVLEAQSFGCPVIASDIPILREIAGERSFFFAPNSPKSAYDTVKFFLSASVDKTRARKDALRNAKRFSWQRSAQIIENEIKCLL